MHDQGGRVIRTNGSSVVEALGQLHDHGDRVIRMNGSSVVEV